MAQQAGLIDPAANAAGARSLYGPTCAAPLAALAGRLREKGAKIIDDLYLRLPAVPGMGALLAVLSDAEIAQYKAGQLDTLLLLASSGLTQEAHREVALKSGRLYASAGVSSGDLILCQEILLAAVRERIGVDEHGEALSLLSRRLMRHLAWQSEAALRFRSGRDEALRRIAELGWQANSYTDLITGVVQALGEHEEIAGCALGRPDRNGVLRFEAVSDPDTATYLFGTGRTLTVYKDGPMSRAWRNGRIERTLNYATDPSMVAWREAAKIAGFRSKAAIPLCQPGGSPIAILTLFSIYPGGFSGHEQAHFIGQLQTLLMTFFARLEGHAPITSSTVSHETRQHWESLLRGGALEMHYQPVLDLHTGQAGRVEALARLRDGGQLLSPGVFFPGLTSADFLELYVRGLDQALFDRRRWLDDGLSVGVSVNLPSSALGDPRYFEATRNALLRNGCPANQLTLEVLETDEMVAGVDMVRELARYKALGVNLAEDDLGTGYSGLARLRNLPFDTIKLDRNIVDTEGGDVVDVLHFVYQLTRLGHTLGKKVVVEGVEKEDLLEAIAILGVDAVQGYVVARPMPAREVPDWMRLNSGTCLKTRFRAGSALGRLARLLVWEEHLHLHLCDVRESNQAPALPFEHVAPGLAQALVAAAVGRGPRSPEYEAARRQLVEALSGR